MEQILINLAAGALGGTGSGRALPRFDMGNAGNIIAGVVGGGVVGQVITVVWPSVAASVQSGNLGAGAIVANVIGSGAGGAILQIIAGMVMKAMSK